MLNIIQCLSKIGMVHLVVEVKFDAMTQDIVLSFTNKQIIIGNFVLDHLTKFFDLTLDHRNQIRYNEMFESVEM